MTYIPTHIEIIQSKITKPIHDILFDYFSYEIEYAKNIHGIWLKYPITEINNMFFLTCKENDKKIDYLTKDFSFFLFVDKKFINNINKNDGVIYRFKLKNIKD